jgi:uncharacterized coiled-coil protein SlyX
MNIYNKVIEHYGVIAQKKKAIEELNELIAEIRKDLDGNYDKQAIISEMADVSNMFEQLLLMYGIVGNDICNEADVKMNRTMLRIEKECESIG